MAVRIQTKAYVRDVLSSAMPHSIVALLSLLAVKRKHLGGWAYFDRNE